MRVLKNNHGVVLISSYLVITVLLIFATVFVGRSVSDKNIALQQKNLAKSFYLAEAGLDQGLDWLRSQSIPPTGTALFYPLGGDQTLAGGTYNVSIDPDDNNPNTTISRFQIISSGTAGGVTRTLVNEVISDHFARFAYFTDGEHFHYPPWWLTVWFITGDVIEGPTHTNGHFHIKGDPVFNDTVGSADNYLTFYNNGASFDSGATSNSPHDEPVFAQGIQLGDHQLDMPSRALELDTAAGSGGYQFSGDTTVELISDGTMNVTNSIAGYSNTNLPLPANDALFVDGGDLYVSGTLNGTLSMGTSQDVIIEDNIYYADDPRINPLSDDMLGLIGEQDVVVSDSAPHNLDVFASVMAMDDSFYVEDWLSGPVKGTLMVYGGIIQEQRGPVGTFDGSTGQKLSGYTKNYIYDSRLTAEPPPFYPSTGDYITISWKEE